MVKPAPKAPPSLDDLCAPQSLPQRVPSEDVPRLLQLALLLVIAQRLALDQLRSAWVQRAEPVPIELLELQADDDAIAALLSREASAQLVDDAMRTAAQRGDHLVVRCVAAWLDLAECSGAPPSSREVAARASVSHTSVANALARFRSYLNL